MEQYELLWRYMEEDGKADAIAREIKESDKRRQLEKHRDTILSQQKLYQEITARCGEMVDREAVISEDALPRYEARMEGVQKVLELKETINGKLERLTQLEKEIEELETRQDAMEDTESAEYQALMDKLDVAYQEEKDLTRDRDEMAAQIDRQLAELAEIEKSLKGFEKELRQILRVNEEDRNKERVIRKKVAAAKMEFDRLKPEFAAEKEALAAEKEALREAEKKRKAVEKAAAAATSSVMRSVSTNIVNSVLGGKKTSAKTIAKRAATNALSSVMRNGSSSIIRGLFGNIK